MEESHQPFGAPLTAERMAGQRPLRASRHTAVGALVCAVALAGAAIAVLAWPRSHPLPPPPPPGYESPANAVSGYTGGLFSAHPTVACRYTAPRDRSLCTMAVTAGGAYAELTGRWTIGNTAVSGSRAIVDVEYQARGTKDGASLVNTNPDAGLPHAGLSFRAAYQQSFGTKYISYTTDCVRIAGRWYVEDVQQGL